MVIITAHGERQIWHLYGGKFRASAPKLNVPCDSEILLLGIHLKEMKFGCCEALWFIHNKHMNQGWAWWYMPGPSGREVEAEKIRKPRVSLAAY